MNTKLRTRIFIALIVIQVSLLGFFLGVEYGSAMFQPQIQVVERELPTEIVRYNSVNWKIVGDIEAPDNLYRAILFFNTRSLPNTK